jgi:hypothetical protein
LYAGVYNRYGFGPEKRHALETWAGHLERLIDPPVIQVVALGGRGGALDGRELINKDDIYIIVFQYLTIHLPGGQLAMLAWFLNDLRCMAARRMAQLGFLNTSSKRSSTTPPVRSMESPGSATDMATDLKNAMPSKTWAGHLERMIDPPVIQASRSAAGAECSTPASSPTVITRHH